MPSCQWELEPEVFVFTVHRVYTLLIHLCPLIRSAHFQVMDDVCSNPPFYYANPFNGAPRLKRCHISWQLAPPPSISFIGCSEWIKLKWGNVGSQIKSNTSQTGSHSADQACSIVSISVFCSIQEFLNVVACIDFAVLSSPTVMRTASSTKTRGYSKQIYANAWPVCVHFSYKH